MFGHRGLHFAALGIAAALCSMTMSVTAPAYFDGGGGTASALTGYDNVIVVSVCADYQPASAFLMPVVKEDRVANDPHPAFRPSAIKERASRAAVRPSALSGWRSGRVRTLAT